MEKIDVRKRLSSLYRVSHKEVVEMDVPPLRYLMIDGAGDPNTSPDYARAVEALFSVSYTTKFAVKKSGLGIDYGVMPLEGLWWADDWSVFTANDRGAWKWTMMILQPDFVPEEMIRRAIGDVAESRYLLEYFDVPSRSADDR